MVRTVEREGKKYFMCEACDMYYVDREWAEKCEKSCTEKKCCDLEVMKNSTVFDEEKGD